MREKQRRGEGPRVNIGRMNAQAPSGWYPDNEGNQRYWDGSSWTQHVRKPEMSSAIGVPIDVKREGAFAKLKKVATDKQASIRSAKEEVQRAQAEAAQAAGALITSGTFGMSIVEVYQRGFVRIATPPENSAAPASITWKTPYERLQSIKFTPPSQGTGGGLSSALEGTVGPAVAGLLKGGAGLMKASAPGLAVAGVAHLAGAEGRKSYLTIATERQVHSLTNQTGVGVVKKIHKAHSEVGAVLEAAGNRVLGVVAEDARQADPASRPPALQVTQDPAPPTLAERLRELAGLHHEGILSEDEFAAAKAKLIGGM